MCAHLVQVAQGIVDSYMRDMWLWIMIVLAVTGVAAVTDVWRCRLYNVLIFPLLAGGVVIHCLGSGSNVPSSGVLGLIVGLTVLVAPYLTGASLAMCENRDCRKDYQ